MAIRRSKLPAFDDIFINIGIINTVDNPVHNC